MELGQLLDMDCTSQKHEDWLWTAVGQEWLLCCGLPMQPSMWALHCCTAFRYVISHCFHIGDNDLMSRDPAFCFIVFNVWSRDTVYAVYYTLFKCYAEGRTINFLSGFSIALIAVRWECLTMWNKLPP